MRRQTQKNRQQNKLCCNWVRLNWNEHTIFHSVRCLCSSSSSFLHVFMQTVEVFSFLPFANIGPFYPMPHYWEVCWKIDICWRRTRFLLLLLLVIKTFSVWTDGKSFGQLTVLLFFPYIFSIQEYINVVEDSLCTKKMVHGQICIFSIQRDDTHTKKHSWSCSSDKTPPRVTTTTTIII